MPQNNKKPNSLDACDPSKNATVSASAGSGKTWLLITRIVRLLIDGAEPSNIIALTFTRKAAGEMQIRLNQRLYEMATTDDEALFKLLKMIGCNTDENTVVIARNLYEKLMHSVYPIRIQTFHSFCQDILSRFPLEADIPPGFELVEDSSLLERQAWQELFDDAGKDSNAQLDHALDFIMQVCNGPDNTHTALHSFLSHRSDWWAFTAQQKNIIEFANNNLTESLQVNENDQPITQFLNDINTQKLMIFANLLRENKNKTSDKHADSIDQALKIDDELTQFSLLKTAFIKKDGDILVQGRKHTAAMEKKLGIENAARFLEMHHEIANKIQETNEHLRRILTLKINKAWYLAGNHYVEIFQRLKRELRLLDFVDLEWKCYQLLQHADNAHWVQYKIDQRIDHLLIDEFQDTNPTQWQLLSPILEEIAANPEQRPRSVFLVGDEKQSIYSFRRANPALQAQASQWLADNLQANATPLDFSRRSSSAIIHSVNQVFEQDRIKAVMTGFTTHDTHLNELPGRVQLCELFSEEEEDDENTEPVYFRNPLEQARDVSTLTLRHKEADYIASQISHIVDTQTQITDDGVIRSSKYGDILILMRNRTHVEIYESALKKYKIPFIGSKKGGLLDNLEIQDLNCLLKTLITPYNNLALAQVLKSPIFNASDDDLILLAQNKTHTHWFERLLQLADDSGNQLSKPLQRAATLLPRWQAFAEHLPVHDCLDKIFSEGNIIQRYIAVNREENKLKVAANCQRFLELSLETDSGRYPSITRFLQQLTHLQKFSQSPPEEPLSQSNESRVKLMTIHGSKGLESPIVFLADCNSSASNKNAYASLVRWPADQNRPVTFQLQLSKDNTDQITQDIQQEKINEQSREELNLLYVALTRAREQLYISGTASKKKNDNSWYQIIAEGLESITRDETTLNGIHCKIYDYLQYEQSSNHYSKEKEKVEPSSNEAVFDIDARLLKPIKNIPTPFFLIAPSLVKHESSTQNKAQEKAGDAEQEIAKWRGTIIHRVLEHLCNAGAWPADSHTTDKFHQRLNAETSLHQASFLPHLETSITEAVTTFNDSDLNEIFNPAANIKTYNEMPMMYLKGQQAVYGIVDRVIKADDEILVIDYKSHQVDVSEPLSQVALQFSEQLDYYRDGIKKLWPEQRVKTGILFTHRREVVWLE